MSSQDIAAPGRRPLRLDDVQIAVLLPLEKEAAGAELMLADDRDLVVLQVDGFGIAAKLCRINLLNSNDYHTVALVNPNFTGNTHSALAVFWMASKFPKLKNVIVCGIAGGAPTPAKDEKDVYLGDIVVVDQSGVLQYDFGHFKLAPTASGPPSTFLEKLIGRRPKQSSQISATSYSLQHEAKLRIHKPATIFDGITHQLKWNRLASGDSPWTARLDARLQAATAVDARYARPASTDRPVKYEELLNGTILSKVRIAPRDYPDVFFGAIGSANVVQKSPFKRDQLRDGSPAIVAIEMEASGVGDACQQLGLGFTVVRGICDYCDVHKADEWHFYAAAVAAAYTYCLLQRMPVNLDAGPVVRQNNDRLEGDTAYVARIGAAAQPTNSASASTTNSLGTATLSTAQSHRPFDAARPITPEVAYLEEQVRVRLTDLDNQTSLHNHKQQRITASHLADTLLTMPPGSSFNRELRRKALYSVANAFAMLADFETNPLQKAELRQQAKGLLAVYKAMSNER